MPNCIGTVDGKHIAIKAPPNAGYLFYNYKKYYSTIIMAACNRRYKFTLVDVGAYGSESDGGILARSEFGKRLDTSTLNFSK